MPRQNKNILLFTHIPDCIVLVDRVYNVSSNIPQFVASMRHFDLSNKCRRICQNSKFIRTVQEGFHFIKIETTYDYYCMQSEIMNDFHQSSSYF